jgi:hypothetical protein
MKKLVFLAAIINLAVAVVHIFIGEAGVVAPLLASDVPELIKGTLHSAWHMISVVLLMSSFALIYVGMTDQDGAASATLPTYIGIQYIGLALVFVVSSFVYGQFFIQILMLLPIGLLSFWAGRLAARS